MPTVIDLAKAREARQQHDDNAMSAVVSQAPSSNSNLMDRLRSPQVLTAIGVAGALLAVIMVWALFGRGPELPTVKTDSQPTTYDGKPLPPGADRPGDDTVTPGNGAAPAQTSKPADGGD